jgi:hypothetical protein
MPSYLSLTYFTLNCFTLLHSAQWPSFGGLNRVKNLGTAIQPETV